MNNTIDLTQDRVFRDKPKDKKDYHKIPWSKKNPFDKVIEPTFISNDTDLTNVSINVDLNHENRNMRSYSVNVHNSYLDHFSNYSSTVIDINDMYLTYAGIKFSYGNKKDIFNHSKPKEDKVIIYCNTVPWNSLSNESYAKIKKIPWKKKLLGIAWERFNTRKGIWNKYVTPFTHCPWCETQSDIINEEYNYHLIPWEHVLGKKVSYNTWDLPDDFDDDTKDVDMPDDSWFIDRRGNDIRLAFN